MCGRYSLAGADTGSLRDRFGLGERVVVRRRFNVAPGDDVLTVTAGRDGAHRGDVLRWGLVPHWAPDPAAGARMINARAETVAEKPAFRDAFARRRCLVLADGFFEWERPALSPGVPKQAWWVTRADGAPFAFAGVWATWRPGGTDSDPLRTCAIVTTRANRAVAGIHDRMPVILPAGAEAAWLDAGTPPGALRALLAPLPEAETALRRVGSAVNDARHDEPDCLDPPPPSPQPALF
jgi:putative SOS response-associated peptidase YedK